MTGDVAVGVSGDGSGPIIVVGAGLAGLVAAGALVAAGTDVVVVDEGAEPGGRLATRRIGPATLDAGAQFFTVRSARFAAMVDGWRADGLPVREWAHGFLRAGHVGDGPAAARPGTDGHARHAVDAGMSAIARRLASDLPRGALRPGTRVRAITPSGDGWRVEVEPGRPLDAAAVVCTPPVPRSLALLAAVAQRVPPAVRQLRYEPCIALLAALDAPPAVPAPGGVQFTRGPVSWLADNAAKGVSATPAVTVHASGGWSADHAADGDEEVVDGLLDLVRPWLGAARPVAASLERWRHSRPLESYPERAVRVPGVPPLVLAGDAFGCAKVEGAALSGLAAADVLLGT